MGVSYLYREAPPHPRLLTLLFPPQKPWPRAIVTGKPVQTRLTVFGLFSPQGFFEVLGEGLGEQPRAFKRFGPGSAIAWVKANSETRDARAQTLLNIGDADLPFLLALVNFLSRGRAFPAGASADEEGPAEAKGSWGVTRKVLLYPLQTGFPKETWFT